MTICLRKPSLVVVRNRHVRRLPHLSLSVTFRAWICTHVHMWARPKHTSVGGWRKNYGLFGYESGEVFLTVSGVCFSLLFSQSPGALNVSSWSSKAPWSRKQTAPPSRSASPVVELSSTPRLSVNMSVVLYVSEPGVQKLLSRSSICILCSWISTLQGISRPTFKGMLMVGILSGWLVGKRKDIWGWGLIPNRKPLSGALTTLVIQDHAIWLC